MVELEPREEEEEEEEEEGSEMMSWLVLLRGTAAVRDFSMGMRE